MNEISPSYYAASVLNSEFVLSGERFQNIPSEAVGVFAWDNNNPLLYRNTTDGQYLYDIVEKTSTEMTLRCRVPREDHIANYLGAIVSPDRQIVYWVNDTKPIP